MTNSTYHLAQLNIGILRGPLDSPIVAGFVAALDPINALADKSPGFVWRLQTEDGNATSVRPFEDESILVNMSVWESREALADFVYRSAHTPVMRRRREWFHQMAEAYLVLWWVPAGHIPSTAEARERLEHLRVHGPTPYAFTVREPFPPPGAVESAEARDDDLCPV
jgi:hypothetical protein